MKQTVLAALALALLPSAAFGQEESAKDVSSVLQPGRHVIPSGELAADFPCAPEVAEEGPTSGQAGLSCMADGLIFFVSVAPSVVPEGAGRAFGTYEENLEGAREDASTARVVEGDFKGLRVFDAWKSSTGRIGRARLIELSKDTMGMALVLEIGSEEVAPGGEERETAFEKAEAFIASLEVLTK